MIEIEKGETKKNQKESTATPKQQIVQSDVAKKTEKAAPDAFLGARTQVTDLETVSKNKMTKMGEAPSQSSPEKKKNKKADTAPLSMPTLSKLGVPYFSADQLSKLAAEQESLQNPSAIPGGAQDYIKGFKESERTVLNTKEYVFYGYFQRIRQRLDLAWDRSLKEQIGKIYRRGRQLASDMEHITRVVVTLNATGEITRVQVIEASGTEDLDEAAVKAFNQAGPFPNPPKGIVDAQGKIQISWDFILRS